MVDRQPGKYEKTLHSAPWFHGGKVPDINYKYSDNGLTSYQYLIKRRSFPVQSKEQMPAIVPVLGRYFQNIDETPKRNEQDLWRQFKEFDYVRENEILTTIEHCSNCHLHSSNTRHNPEKYVYVAEKLKKAILERFPTVKVLCKPINLAGSAKEIQAFLPRIGAFEIQVYSRILGRVQKATLHSKLITKAWPMIPEVLQKLSSFLPKFQLFVTVFDPNKTISEDPRLRGIKIRVKAQYDNLQHLPPGMSRASSKPLLSTKSSQQVLKALPRPLSATSYNTSAYNSRPQSAKNSSQVLKQKRPQSASSGLKSFEKLSKIQSRPASAKPTVNQPFQLQIFEATTDKDGRAAFKDLPLNVYQISVIETMYFRAEDKIIEAFKEPEGTVSVNVLIPLKSKEICVMSIVLIDPAGEFISNATVRADKGATQSFLLKEKEQGVYEASLPLAEFQLFVKAKNMQEVTKNFETQPGEYSLTINMKAAEKHKLTCQVRDIFQGQLQSNVVLTLQTGNKQQLQTLTNNEGECVFQIIEAGTVKIIGNKTGFVESVRYIYIPNVSQDYKIYIGIIPVSNDVNTRVIFTWGSDAEDIETGILCPQGCRISPKKEECEHNTVRLEADFPQFGFWSFVLLPPTGNAMDKSSWFRILFHFLTKELQEGNIYKQVTHFQSFSPQVIIVMDNIIIDNILPAWGYGKF